MQFPHRAQSALIFSRSAPGGRSALRPLGPKTFPATTPAAAAGIAVSKARRDTAAGRGIVYSSHIYPWKFQWDKYVLAAAGKHPLFIGEVGNPRRWEDFSFIVESARKCGCMVVCEEHSVIGGLCSAVSEALARNYPVPCEFVAMQDRFGKSGSYEELMGYFELDAAAIVEAVKKAMGRKAV